MEYFNRPNQRTFSVRFLSPTNHRGARVKITDLVREESVTLGYDYAMSYIYEQAAAYLIGRGIDDLTLCVNNQMDCYLITSSNFEIALR
tara:strand:- start:1803 stop:2069 length:267 start_codon:yes stop_codon:yes gene_type:complete